MKFYHNEWPNQVQNKPKLRFYKRFKKEPNVEDYIKLNMNCMQRSYMCQLRLGILPIAIEIGRYKSIPINERFCMICNQNLVEDEIHLLFYCNEYDAERKSWFRDIDLDISMIHEVNDCLLEYIFMFPRQTAKFVCDIMEKRRTLLYQ